MKVILAIRVTYSAALMMVRERELRKKEMQTLDDYIKVIKEIDSAIVVSLLRYFLSCMINKIKDIPDGTGYGLRCIERNINMIVKGVFDL